MTGVQTCALPIYDKCHLEELNIPIQQVRWWVEDENGNHVDGNGIVKMEYPIGFFGEGKK